jgi:hypothetical protein
MALLATFDHLWEPKWNPIRNYQTVSLSTRVNKREITLSALTIHREFIASDYSAHSEV